MRLRTLLTVGAFASLTMSVAVGAGLLAISNQYDQALVRERQASGMVSSVQNLVILSGDYLLYRYPRVYEQWQRQYRALGNAMEDMDGVWEPLDRQHMQAEHARLQRLFERVVQSRPQPDGNAPVSPTEKALTSQLQSTLQAMGSQVIRLRDDFHHRSHALAQRVRWLMLTMSLFLLFVVGGVWLVVATRVIRPVTGLMGQMPRLAEDASFRLPVFRGDEMGDLAATFNGLASRLQDTLVSREALQKSESRLKDAQELGRIGNWELDFATEELWWSDEAYRIFEVDPAHFQPSYAGFLRMVHADDRERVDKAYRRSVSKGTVYQITHRVVVPGGAIKHVIERGRMELDPQGRPLRSIGTLQDVTEQTKAQIELAENKARLDTLLDTLPDLVWLRDPQGIYLACNRRFEDYMGVVQARIVGSDDARLRSPEEGQRIRDRDLAIMRDGEATTSEHWVTFAADGHRELLEIILTPMFGKRGELLGILGVGRDITRRRQAEQELVQSNRNWVEAMDQFADAIYVLDMQRRLVRANHAFYRIAGTDPKSAVGEPIADIVHPEGACAPCPVCRMQSGQEDGRVVLERDDPHNFSGVPVEATLKMLKDDDGQPSGMLMSLHDLTQSRKIEERLRLAAGVLENAGEGVMITDTQARVVEVNPAFSEILGYSREEVLARTPSMFKSGRHDESFYRNMWRSLDELGSWRGEIWNRRRDGSIVPMLSTITSVTDESGHRTHYVAMYNDISQIKHSQEQLDYLAHHDALTGLPNRLLLNERLEHAIKRAQRNEAQLAVIYLDLDRFKHINDSLGHPVGDQLLQMVAANLMQAVRQDDTVCRVGGDEFVLVLEEVGTTDSVAVVAKKILQCFTQPFFLDVHEVTTTSSLGISLYPSDGDTPATLLRNADAAMYRAKEDGRNTFQFYSEEFTRDAFERVVLENNLRHALEREELFLVYQPQIQLEHGRVLGVEALLRWQHPELGIVPPGQFIPFSEDTGLIIPIGEWVLRTACRQTAEWVRRGVLSGRVAVNISGPQMQRGGLPALVREILDETGLAAEHLELEITEGFIMRRTEAAVKQLSELRDMGVALAIDDFGTGYSSLSYLKQLPVHKLKIDRSFVKDIPQNLNDAAIARAVIALGNSLGLTVIAEGVENEAQARFLLDNGCFEAQGFLYAKPQAADALEGCIARGAEVKYDS